MIARVPAIADALNFPAYVATLMASPLAHRGRPATRSRILIMASVAIRFRDTLLAALWRRGER
jgi:hypothetical protein